MEQDVERWVRELKEAGWVAITYRRNRESGRMEHVEIPTGTTWRAPNGALYRGPFRAWQVMRFVASCVSSPREGVAQVSDGPPMDAGPYDTNLNEDR